MIVVSGTITVDPADHDAAAALMQTLVEETAKEAGSVSYAFYADLESPGTFRVFEEWESDEAHRRALRRAAHGRVHGGPRRRSSVTGTDDHQVRGQ